ncbi:MAG: hypothetical protein COB51_01405, partial [Moraxellaceae bacterium]
WAMEEAARTLAEWDARAGGDCGVKLAVNLSAIQLQRDQISAMVKNALDGTEIQVAGLLPNPKVMR